MLEPMIARAFLWKLLTEPQRKELVSFEKSLPPGRYLQASEICHRFSLSPKARTELQIQEMHRVARKFSGLLYQSRKKMLRADDADLTDHDLNRLADGKIAQDDWLEWVRFADLHYQEPQPYGHSRKNTEGFLTGSELASGD